MKRKITTILLLLSISLSSMQCEKEKEEPEPTLPAETQTGANTFGCLVNGEVWLPRSNFPYSSLTTVIQFDILSIRSRNFEGSINLGLRDLTIEQNYTLKEEDNSFKFKEINYRCVEGIITITKYDKANQIISGRFNAKGKSEAGETVNITDGRFDLKFTN